ncbi:MAG: pyridoxamine 5'-phosphate oxidase [Balneolaceae bacterium]|nr:MAG: pyridoxamine 5'-phosphate oxidase [Balneolaceae bacterium]
MLRREYTGIPLLEESVSPNPIDQFRFWFDEALKIIKDDPNAMLLSTVDSSGQPSSRTVLLKGFGEDGFIFYTNYKSRKGLHIDANPQVSLTFYWPELMRQIHIEGRAKKISEKQSDDYFRLRPDASKIAALASSQSSELKSRAELEQRRDRLKVKYKGGNIPRPPHWGGYIIKHERVEFWQGRLNRLHDRICYTFDGKQWNTQRLAP